MYYAIVLHERNDKTFGGFGGSDLLQGPEVDKKKKNVYEKKQFSEFKTAKVNCQRKPYGQTGKNPSSCMEREESKSSVFSISVKLFPHVYLTTSEFRNNSAFPDFFCASKSS